MRSRNNSPLNNLYNGGGNSRNNTNVNNNYVNQSINNNQQPSYGNYNSPNYNNQQPNNQYTNNVNGLYNRDFVKTKEDKREVRYNLNDDYELINTYVGVNQQKLLFNTKNFSALIFGEYYLFYRKLYIAGSILFFIKLVIALFLNRYLALIVNLIPFFFFNKFYVFYITKQIQKLKKKYPASKIDLLNEVEKNGGISYIHILKGLGIQAIIIFVLFIISLIFGFSSVFSDFVNHKSRGKFVEPDVYDGTLLYNQKVRIKSKIKVTMPKEFTDESNDYSYSGFITLGKNTVFNKCEFTIRVIDNYRNVDNLVELMSNFYRVDYTRRTINGTKWYHIKTDSRGSDDIYVTKKGGNIYIYRYTIGIYADNKLCSEYNEETVSTLTFK